MSFFSKGLNTILITLIIAFILTLLPLPEWAASFRPQWIAMVVIYWSLALPHRFGIVTAWIIGLFLDVLTGTLLGEHALALSIIIYIILRSYARVRLFPIWQQSIVVALLLMLYQFIILWPQSFIHRLPVIDHYWISPFISMLLWPWAFYLLRATRRKYKVK